MNEPTIEAVRKTLTVKKGLHKQFKKAAKDRGLKIQFATDQAVTNWLTIEK